MTLLIILLGLLIGGIFCLEERGSVPLNNELASQIETWEQASFYAPTPGNLDRLTPSVYCPSPNRLNSERSSSLRRPGRLGSHDEASNSNLLSCQDDTQTYINYRIEWRAFVNNRGVARDTEEDLVLKPSSYWQQIKEKADQAVRQRLRKASNQRVRSYETTIVVSVNERSERDLTKSFETNHIDWTAIDRQLLKWEPLFRKGKRLRLSMTIRYTEDTNPSPPGRTDKRGSSSTTIRMLGDLDDQIDAEESSGRPTYWRDVYKKMRCPGPPCHHEGQYCWQDPVSKKHYRLRTHHLRSLVKYVENHGVINTHDDVPEAIREQLFAEERQQIDRRQKSPNLPASSSALPAININVLPTPSSQQLSCSYGDQSKSSRIEQAHSFKISESFEEALENYANWHLGRVSTVNSREHIIRARDIALEKCLDLQQIFIDNDPESFPGVAIGMARRFANDIPLWLEDREHRNGTEEPENE